MNEPAFYRIKSFKHNGHLHRIWLENRRVPGRLLHPAHRSEDMIVMVNCQTKIIEADGSEWFSKSPGVSFFIPGEWYNIVALLENTGIRYYCNIASPVYLYGYVLTYIDYDLDLILTPDGTKHLVDLDEYEKHRFNYHYSAEVEEKVKEGLVRLTDRMERRDAPFCEEPIRKYFAWWQLEYSGEGGRKA